MTKRILSILTAVMLLIAPTTASAADFEYTPGEPYRPQVYLDGKYRFVSDLYTYEDFQYYFREDGTIALCKYLGYETNRDSLKIVIPASINATLVTRLGDNLFQPPYAKYKKNFISRLHSTFRKVEMPDTINSMGDGVFADCHSLTTANISEQMTVIPKNMFSGAMSLERFTIPNHIKEIEAGAFSGTAIRELDLPNSIEVIGAGAFAGTPIKEFDIPSSVKYIHGYAFRGTDIEAVTLKRHLKEVSGSAFADCKKLKSVTIEDTVKVSGEGVFGFCFTNCKNLKTYRIAKNAIVDVKIFAHDDEDSPYRGIKVYGYKGSSAHKAVNKHNRNIGWEAPLEVTFIPLTSLKKTKVKGVKAVKYTKSVKKNGAKQSVKVYVKGKKLKKGKDYTLSYKNNKKRGKATVIITGINKYDGVIKRTFRIK